MRSDPAGIDCPGRCAATFDDGVVVRLTARPEARNDFAGFGGGCSGPACTVELRSDHKVWATFVERPVTLAVQVEGSGTVTSSPAPIDCPRSCTAAFAAGTTVVLRQVPAPGYRFAGFRGSCSGDSCALKLADDAMVLASFVAIPFHKLNVTLGGSGGGRVTSLPAGIDCPGACSASFAEGTAVALSAAPDVLSRPAKWSGACSGPRCAVRIDSDTAVSAQFDLRRYRVQELAGVGSFATAISPHNVEVVGSLSLVPRSFLWSGAMRFPSPPDGDLRGVNDAAVVAGVSMSFHAYRWEGGVVTDLSHPGEKLSAAEGINRDGVVVGWYLINNEMRAVAWTSKGAIELGWLSAVHLSSAYGVNAAGVAVGMSLTNDGQLHPVRFRPGAVDDLGTLGGNRGTACGISDSGLIVGESYFDATGVQHGFFYQDGRMVDAGALPGLPYSTLYAVNAAGLAAGVGFDSSGSKASHAIVYGAGRIDLNTLVDGTDLTITYAKGVDESGVIAGGGRRGSDSHAVILWPEER